MIKNTLKLLQPIATKKDYFNITYQGITPNPNKLFAYYGDREVTLQSIIEDPHVTANIQARLAGVQSLEYEIVYDDTNLQYKDIFEAVINKIDIKKFIDKAMDAVFYGYNVFEINWHYEYIDGKLYLLPFSLVEKPRSWFVFDNHNILRLNNFNNKTLPGYKFLLIQHKPTFDNPYGEALLSKCLWPVVFKKSGFTFWVLLAEKLGIPHLIGKTDAAFGTEEFDAFMNALENLMQDGSIVIPNSDEIEAINPATAVNVDIYNKLIDKCNTEISKALLSQTLTTDIGDAGSRAASQTHKEVKDELVKSDKLIIEEAIYKLFKWITYFNFNNINVPYVRFYKKEAIDKSLADFVDVITKNNHIKFTKQFYINRFNFNEDEFELIDHTNYTNHVNHTPEYSDDVVTWDQILIDNLADKALIDNANILNVVIDKIKDFIKSQTSYDDAIKHLPELLSNLNSNDFEDSLTNILFLANVIGRLSVLEELKHA